jgi:hypothetical protein
MTMTRNLDLSRSMGTLLGLLLCTTILHAQHPQWAYRQIQAEAIAQGFSQANIIGITAVNSQGHVIGITEMGLNSTNYPLEFLGQVFQPSAVGENSRLLLAFDSTGTVLWHRVFSTQFGPTCEYTLSIDDEDRINLFIGGNIGNAIYFPDTTLSGFWPSFGSRMFRLQPDGAFDRLVFDQTSSFQRVIEAKGNYLGFMYGGNPGYNGMRLINEDGVILWDLAYQNPIGFYEYPRYTVLADSSMVVAGAWNTAPLAGETIDGPVANETYYAFRVSQAGELLWYKSFASDGNNTMGTNRRMWGLEAMPGGGVVMMAEQANEVVFAGEFFSSGLPNSRKILFMIVDDEGNEVAGYQIAGNTNVLGSNEQPSLSVGPTGRIFFASQTFANATINGYSFITGPNTTHPTLYGCVDPVEGLQYLDIVGNATCCQGSGNKPKVVQAVGNGFFLFAQHLGSPVSQVACLEPVEWRDIVTWIRDVPKPVPQIAFTVDIAQGQERIIAIRDSTIGADTYAWTFGDGGTSTGTTPVHVYMNGGQYSVCLTATNACGASSLCEVVDLFGGFTLRPDRGNEGSVVLSSISGGGVVNVQQVRLKRSGEPDIAGFGLATVTSTNSFGTLFTRNVRFDLAGAALGAWDVELTFPDSVVTLANGFQVLPDAGIQLQMDPLPSSWPIPFREGAFDAGYPFQHRARGGAHSEGFRLRNTGGETAFLVPVVSIIPEGSADGHYERNYRAERLPPTIAPGYQALQEFRNANGFSPLVNVEGLTNLDFVIKDGRRIRTHLIPYVKPGATFTHYTSHAVAEVRILNWIATNVGYSPLFGSRIMAGENAPLSLSGMAEFVRLAASEVMGMPIDATACGACFTQAQEFVLDFYRQEVLADIVAAGVNEQPRVFMVTEVLENILARVLQSNCVPNFTIANINAQLFHQIRLRAFELFVDHPQVRPCPPPPPTQPFPVVNTRPVRIGGSSLSSSGRSGAVFGPVLLPSPVITPPLPGAASTLHGIFFGSLHGDGTVTGTVTVITPEGPAHGAVKADLEEAQADFTFEILEDEVVVQSAERTIRSGGVLKLTSLGGLDFVDELPDEVSDCLFPLAAYDHQMSDAEFETAVNDCMRLGYMIFTEEDLLETSDPATSNVALPASAFPQDGCFNKPTTGPKWLDKPLAFEYTALNFYGNLVLGHKGFNCSYDPNEKYGPGDNQENIWVRSDTDFNYEITFENDPDANAAALSVTIEDVIDLEKFDISTMEFLAASVAGDVSIEMRPDDHDGIYLVDMRPRIPHVLMLRNEVNENTGLVRWTFTALDTITLAPSTDALAGFLPPNDSTYAGCGSVSFRIQKRNTVISGDTLRNQASIIFDQNDPILTSVWTNILDDIAPQSEVNALPAVTLDPDFSVSWSGSDAVGVIDRYRLYASMDGESFVVMGEYQDEGPIQLSGSVGETYYFYTRAIDKAGNFEDAPADGYDTSISIEAVGIDENDADRIALLCFPNPATDLVMVMVSARDPATGYRVFDAAGHEVLQGRTNMAGRFDLNIRDLKPGMYLVQVYGEGRMGTVRFMKE